MRDIVFPDKNEKEFFELAKTLGYNELILVYNSKKAAEEAPKPPSGLKVKTAVLAAPQKSWQLRKEIFTIVKCSEQDRNVLERGSADILFGLEHSQPKDYMHQRGSGLNQVLCTLAKKNKVAIGFSFANILSTKGSQRVKLIGRMIQNIKLCRKYKVKTVIASFATEPWMMRSPHDIQSFFVLIGMHPSDAKSSFTQKVGR